MSPVSTYHLCSQVLNHNPKLDTKVPNKKGPFTNRGRFPPKFDKALWQEALWQDQLGLPGSNVQPNQVHQDPYWYI